MEHTEADFQFKEMQNLKIFQSLDVRVIRVNVTHLKCRTGLAIVGVLSSKGSIIIVKPEKGI